MSEKYKVTINDQFIGHFYGHTPEKALRKAIKHGMNFYPWMRSTQFINVKVKKPHANQEFKKDNLSIPYFLEHTLEHQREEDFWDTIYLGEWLPLEG